MNVEQGEGMRVGGSSGVVIGGQGGGAEQKINIADHEDPALCHGDNAKVENIDLVVEEW